MILSIAQVPSFLPSNPFEIIADFFNDGIGGFASLIASAHTPDSIKAVLAFIFGALVVKIILEVI